VNKLCKQQVRNIRGYHRDAKWPQWMIAEMFGVSLSTVSRIVRRVTWKHVHQNGKSLRRIRFVHRGHS